MGRVRKETLQLSGGRASKGCIWSSEGIAKGEGHRGLKKNCYSEKEQFSLEYIILGSIQNQASIRSFL